jgi:NADPH2:quinone reductase
MDLPVLQSQTFLGPDHRNTWRDLIIRPGCGQDGGCCRCTCHSYRPQSHTGVAEAKHIDAVLDLVGDSTILDSLDMLRRDGTACLAGWLGGLDPIVDFNPLLRMASGVNWSFFGSFVFGNPGFPLSDVPLQDIAAQVAVGRLDAAPSRVFPFDEIREAHRLMEAGGKMVVVVK